jgi:hypothetical protein
MHNEPYVNAFQDVHKKIQDKKDGLRRANEARWGVRKEDAEKEAIGKKFDRPAMQIADPTDEITK